MTKKILTEDIDKMTIRIKTKRTELNRVRQELFDLISERDRMVRHRHGLPPEAPETDTEDCWEPTDG